MVHSRFNEKESNPNPHINFITPLPAADDSSEDAKQYLRALAAQVRPIMKAQGFTVNSLEEYEHNSVFAGRNWNNGETIELVLRRPGGSFLPSSWLMSTFCHELAHIKHMNHGPDFQALWRQLRNDVRQLQDKGYYGDGYWSAGTRLADSAVVSGQGLDTGELPEYMCGGAQTRTRPAALRRRRGPRRPREIVASNKTGRQTAKQRKAGSRVTSKYAFTGEGVTLSGGDADASGKGFRKQAGSKRAREERALAAERRLQALTQSSSSAPAPTPSSHSDGDDAESDEEIIFETDAERREALRAAENSGDQDTGNKLTSTSWKDFEDDFVFTGQGRADATDLTSESDSDEEEESDHPELKSNGKRKFSAPLKEPPSKLPKTSKEKEKEAGPKLGLGKLVKTEVDFRKREALGMVKGKGRTIGSGLPNTNSSSSSSKLGTKVVDNPQGISWSCLVCTLENEPLHLACAVCGAVKGERSVNA